MNWLVVAGKLRFLTEKLDAVTLPSYFAKRFEDNTHVLKVYPL